MMTQSVMTQATNLFGSAKESATSKSKQKGSGFDIFMDKNLKSGQGSFGIAETSGEKKNVMKPKDTHYDKNDISDQNVHKSEPTVTTDKKAAAKSGEETDSKGTVKTVDTKEVNETTGEETKKAVDGSAEGEIKEVSEDEQLMAQILGMLQQAREAIMEALQLSPEEFDQLMAKYNALNGEISTVDLLQPDILRQLVLTNSGETDLLSVLTDENLADTMKQLIQTVDQIKAEADLPLTIQQIREILEQAKNQTTETDSTLQDTLGTSNMMVQKEGLKDEQVTIVNKNQTNLDASLPKGDLAEATNIPISDESSAGTGADISQGDNKDFDTTDQFQVFMDKMVQVTQTTQADFSGNMVQITELREIANQIIEHIKVVVNPEQSSMELQLNPEHLGKVNLTVQSKNGVMTAQFVVQNESCREAIESQMHTLREALNQQGLKVDSIEVTVSANAFEQSAQAEQDNQPEGQKNQSGRKISLEDAMAMSELPEVENSILDTDELRGSQIDYTA